MSSLSLLMGSWPYAQDERGIATVQACAIGWGQVSRALLESGKFSGSGEVAGTSSPTSHFQSVNLLLRASQEEVLSLPPCTLSTQR